MKPSIMLSVIVAITACSACSKEANDDGVPKVDIHGTIVVVEPASTKGGFRMPERKARLISVANKQMPLQEFLLTYCQGKTQNETCSRGSSILAIDAASGPVTDLPKGL